ncbi:hypothetical protein THRCLA_21486 [Thraustotheca clavata]|uniref:Uncharacterized protein n=1 Tax=Thraustotheca clavata TaxID=74557 RepID=A0A1V9ZW06_9STRA|nr:hypothetical protein THRCLA_21486 [Thraustotheca clavata]
MSNDSDVETSVRGGVYHRGNFEYNGEGMIIGFATVRKDSGGEFSPSKRKLRCGNCGCRSHKTVDCAFLTESDKGETTPTSD